MKRIKKFFVGSSAVAVTGLVAAAILQLNLSAKEALPIPKFNVSSAPVSRQTGATSFAPALKKASASVVNIYSTRVIPIQEIPFNRYFGGNQRYGRQMPEYQAKGLGSGVVVSSDGYILTANHVIEDASYVRVGLSDGSKEIRATVVGADPATDIAVLKVDEKDLPAITLADSDKIEVGDVALAIGNPFAVGQTVTMGIISGLGRKGVGINGERGYENFIQTDAAVNPGNSGGALVDVEGRLIGINTAIFSQSGGNEGIGFAVPVNLARKTMEQILKNGKVMRGFLGVGNLQTVTPDLAKWFDMSAQEGVLVNEVVPGAPADKAGFKELDAIVEFNGQKVQDSDQLRLIVAETSPGKNVTVKVIRDGKEKVLSPTLGTLPEDSQASSRSIAPDNTVETSTDPLEGVTIVDMTARMRRQLGAGTQVQGPVVTSVDSDSPAAEDGLMPGDVILEVNRKPVTTADQVLELAGKSTTKGVLLRVLSRDETGNTGKRFVLIQS